MSQNNHVAPEQDNCSDVNGFSSAVVQPLLTDLYQIRMACAHWKNGRHNDSAVFDLYFRKNPFHGEFTIFAGLESCLKFVSDFRYSRSDIEYLKTILIDAPSGFFDYLSKLTCSDIKIYAIPEGTVVFPRIPLITVEGPLAVLQLLETTLLNLVNFASLITTNAARYRLAAGLSPRIRLLEFGLRRAQGPDGALSASKYCYMGGFDGTSNVLAAKLYNIPVSGTMAHAFIMSYIDSESIPNDVLMQPKNGGKLQNFGAMCKSWLTKICAELDANSENVRISELVAFIYYASVFPNEFLALVDTYHTTLSGLINFCAVALALNDLGYRAIGIRIDSGDLAYLSHEAYKAFVQLASTFQTPWMTNLLIVASNDINEQTILSLNEQTHHINCYGIGTNLVTCQQQPALGCVYKLVEVNRQPCIKLSGSLEKVTVPGRKRCFRLYGSENYALVDLMQMEDEDAPAVLERCLVRHPFDEIKRAHVKPSRVEDLHHLFFEKGEIKQSLPPLKDLRSRVQASLETLRPDIRRSLNPTPYKVSVSAQLYNFMHELWQKSTPTGEIK